MTIKYFCDRCNKELMSIANLTQVKVQRGERIPTADLCNNCVEELKGWLFTPPPQAASTPRASQK